MLSTCLKGQTSEVSVDHKLSMSQQCKEAANKTKMSVTFSHVNSNLLNQRNVGISLLLVDFSQFWMSHLYRTIIFNLFHRMTRIN